MLLTEFHVFRIQEHPVRREVVIGILDLKRFSASLFAVLQVCDAVGGKVAHVAAGRRRHFRRFSCGGAWEVRNRRLRRLETQWFVDKMDFGR